MKKTLIITGAAALVAGGLALYLVSRLKKGDDGTSEQDEHSKRVRGEKSLRRAMRLGKKHELAAN